MIQFDDLLEPNKLFKQTLKADHHENVVEFFNGMTDKSGVDVDANSMTVRSIKEKAALINKLKKQRNNKKAFSSGVLGRTSKNSSSPYLVKISSFLTRDLSLSANERRRMSPHS